MNRQTLGILIGTICAVVLTPLVAILWRRLAPPTLERSEDLSVEAWRRSDVISKEALIVTGLAGVLFVSHMGFGTVVDSVVVVLMISGVFGIPTAWILLRGWIFGPRHAIEDFGRYFERKHGISFRSSLYVGSSALAISILCLVALLSRA